MYKHIIFDFDGTINDSSDFALKTFLDLTAKKFGRKFESLKNRERGELIDEFKNISFREIKSRFKLNLLSFFYIVKQVQDEEYKFISSNPKEVVLKELPFYDGVLDVIEKLKKEGYKVYLLSSNGEKTLRLLLEKVGKEDLFVHISGGTKLFGKHTKLKSLLSKYKMKKEETMYIGDEIRDIDASRKAGIDVTSVTWGYSGKKILKKNHPTYICEEVSQLESIITSKK
ncbi:HAD-IA family hydrolase [Candidatus Dojkabacteria bacterium]|nr:HAD-IA family hydrolase [Candidatus Dojkabacteria bacterium]